MFLAREEGCRAAIIAMMLVLALAGRSGASGVEGAPADTILQRFAARVFLEGSVDVDYVKARMTFVNYVRDRFDADVHILVTPAPTVIGGTEYTVQFTGRGAYERFIDTLRYVSKPADPLETSRSGLLGVRYVVRTPLAQGIAISYRLGAGPTAVVDPWDYWHFRISTSGSLSGSENSEYGYGLGSLSARRVTPAFKIAMNASLQYSESRQTLPTRTVTYDKRRNTGDATLVKSPGSIGPPAASRRSSIRRTAGRRPPTRSPRPSSTTFFPSQTLRPGSAGFSTR